MDRQEDLIKQIESSPRPEGLTGQPQQAIQPSQTYQDIPQYTPAPKPVVKRSFFDILTLVSYVVLGIAATVIAILLIYANFS